ncbi:MAG: sugar ABC transporter substrate-binding protein, partial [Fischerella sp.]|nr:sugar ABC transporter substrate-binding protein [Fischerella sp.]
MIQVQKCKRLAVWALLGLLTSWIVSCSMGNVSPNTKQASSGVAIIEFWTMQL